MFDILLPAWLCGMILSLLSAPLGAFVVWRKMSYFGDTLSHASLLGVALGLLLEVNPYFAVIIIVLLLACLLVWLENYTAFSADTLLGIIAHSSLSLGVVAIALMDNVRVDLISYLFGDILAVDYADLYWVIAGAAIVLLILLRLWKPLLATTISAELAQIEGINTRKMQMILMLMTALTIALSMKFVGALIITSLLIIPAATARRFAKTPEQMVMIGYVISCVAISLGLGLSALYDTPAGPSIVIAASMLFMLSLFKSQQQ
ncbi:zinc transport system permease protein [Pasteurella testudinis DSM 23072]|uniref:High-affinity zinc uptake system membrane protein ZnuB n=1 Tax=Pasteurella testudinis DSM 23072 TaxID=1122938 RepID=A0A1W1VA12_9PAST|nr:zinc ABC transporter permease subunit ZnuB [Pasteurella testudinis]SMB90106.1 zinc transport system permease protein [Pasteurella testudinis DSM 23072]SUB51333.1 high-affinity zinc uptake system membrane protein ZnuB [Pasteurella testudinis]